MTSAARAGVLSLLLVLAGCAGTGRRSPTTADTVDPSVAVAPHWTLQGRIAVSDGSDGGSGRIDWRQGVDEYLIEIRAPVTRRSWRLSGDRDSARLEGLDDGVREGESAEALLSEHVGWSVPLADLAAWARGRPGAGAADVDRDGSGRLLRIRQRGWLIEYRGWSAIEPALPTKVFASRGTQRVRLIVERWNGVPARR